MHRLINPLCLLDHTVIILQFLIASKTYESIDHIIFSKHYLKDCFYTTLLIAHLSNEQLVEWYRSNPSDSVLRILYDRLIHMFWKQLKIAGLSQCDQEDKEDLLNDAYMVIYKCIDKY